MPGDNLVLCYNRGCGQSFDPSENGPESCRHHSGVPVFHDAYKGWSCCKKKCTDFTEFLNIKGCTVSSHSNIKPPEPEKPKKQEFKEDVVEYRAPLPPKPKNRPDYNQPMVSIKKEVSQSLRDQLTQIKATSEEDNTINENLTNIPIGTSCKNNSCKATYEGPETLSSKCTHHPGYPVFHEGLKFWSCCNKKTTEFNVFLEQVGCKIGDHVWFKKKNEGEAKCRLDWHQTGSHVFVTIYAKKCDPDASSVQLSSVRLKFSLFFPEQNASYDRDIHLCGTVNVEKSSVTYFPAKIEVKLVKDEPGSWSKLDLPSDTGNKESKSIKEQEPVVNLTEQVDSVDLSCI